MIISILIIILYYLTARNNKVITKTDDNMGKHRKLKINRNKIRNTAKIVNGGTKKLKFNCSNDLKLHVAASIINERSNISRYEFLSEFIKQYVTLCKNLVWISDLPKNIEDLEKSIEDLNPELFTEYINKLKLE